MLHDLQVKQLFGFCGQVKSCRMVGNNQFAFVEYSSPGVSLVYAQSQQPCVKQTMQCLTVYINMGADGTAMSIDDVHHMYLSCL